MSRRIPAVFDDLGVGVVVHDPESCDVLEVNSRFEELYGYSESELQEMAVGDFSIATEGFTQAEAERLIHAAADGEPQTFDWHVERASGELLWASVRLVRTELDGEPYVIAEVRDISDRKEADRQREELLNRMSDGFFAVDSEWKIIHANEQATTVLAAAMDCTDNPGDIIGCQLWEEVPDAVDTELYDRYHEAMNSQEPVTFEMHYEPLDTWFDIRAYPSETGLSIYFYDITERRRQRELLEHRQKRLREMYEIISDYDREFDDQIKALLRLGRSELGIEYGTLTDIEGEECVFEFVDADDDSIQSGDVVPVAATNCERVVNETETVVLADIARDAPEETDRQGFTEMGIASYIGAPVFVDDTVDGTFCYYDTDTRDQFSEWEVTLVDLMARWVSYERQRQATTERLQQQNETLERFASTVSHDLRNPLNILDGRLELAESTGEAEHFAACYRAVDRMNTLIDELLSLARAGEGIDDLDVVDLAAVVDGCWTTVETEGSGLRVETQRTIRTDETRLKQLLENLFRNSVEHGGENVSVTVGDLDDGFYVEDDGDGIPEADRETVFESGYTTNTDGTGFGLGIVADIADAHGWQVTITDSENGGARFEFTGVEIVDAA